MYLQPVGVLCMHINHLYCELCDLLCMYKYPYDVDINIDIYISMAGIDHIIGVLWILLFPCIIMLFHHTEHTGVGH